MTKRVEKRFVYHDLGFPIVLLNVPVVDVMGEQALDIDLNLLQKVVLEHLATKKGPLDRRCSAIYSPLF